MGAPLFRMPNPGETSRTGGGVWRHLRRRTRAQERPPRCAPFSDTLWGPGRVLSTHAPVNRPGHVPVSQEISGRSDLRPRNDDLVSGVSGSGDLCPRPDHAELVVPTIE